MTLSHFRFLSRPSALFCAAMLLLAACNISQEEKVNSNISFNKIYDDLAVYDSVVIALKDEQGRTLDIVFKGKVESPSDVENLPAPHWDGGKVVVSISGFNAAGDEVYKIEANFDGKTNQKDTVKTFRFPGSALSILDRSLLMAEGDSLSLPTVTVEPANLADKTLLWSSSDVAIAEIRGGLIKAMGPGSAEITARLQADPSVTAKVQVTVEPGGRIPETLALALDTLYVPAGGASRIIPVKVMPLTASAAVTWRSDNVLVATVAEDGAISGLVAGLTTVRVASKIKPSLSDSAWVMVTEPIPVASVRFISDSVDIFIGGAAELLGVEVLPREANTAVEFTIQDPAMVELKDNRISGLAEGRTTVTVKSKEDPLKWDTLKVRIHPNQHVDSVRVSPKTLKLFVGGDKLDLIGKVYPASAPQAIQWVSGNKAHATVDSGGKVAAVAAGNLMVYAYSQVDSLARDSASVIVKVDPPVVRIGEDTVVSVGQTITFLPVVETQEYGLVTGFKWDLDGDSVWDDSAVAVRSVSYKYDQEKVYQVRFWVKDTEGNETVVSKSVRAVKGAVVLIQSPLNNSYSRVAVIAVQWTVDGTEQDSLLTQTLKDGPNTITRTVKDAAGKEFSHSITVTLDSVAPAAPSLAVVASVTRDPKPNWSWSSSGNGQFEYRLASGSAPTGPGTAISALSFASSTGLVDGTWFFQVREKDAAENWSAWSSNSVVTVKSSAPKPPSVSRNATITNAPKWTWSPAGGGNGTFQYRWNGNPAYLGSGSGTEYAPTTLSETTHNLCVSELDAVGNGGETCVSITVDRTSPVIDNYSIADGYITNTTPITIGYTKDKASESFSCDLSDGKSTLCSKTVYDAANNPATVSRNVWYRNNVIFVRQGQTGGKGSNWDSAYGDISTAIASIGGKSGRFEIWVGEGSYAGFELTRSNTSIYGGFNSTGYPNSLLSRDLQSKISRIRPNSEGVMLGISGESPVVCRNAIVDGFHINDEAGQAITIFTAENARLENFWVEANKKTDGGAGLIAIAYSDAVFQRVYIRDNYLERYHPIYLFSGGKLDMFNSEVINNSISTSWGGAGIHHEGGGGMTIRNSLLYKNSGGNNNYQVFSHSGGLVDIDSCTVHSGRVGVRPLAEDDPDSQAIKWGPNNKTY